NVLALAAGQDRILVSHDFRTMPQHFADFLQARGSSPGLLLVPQYLPIGESVEELVLIWCASEAEEWENRVRTASPTVMRFEAGCPARQGRSAKETAGKIFS